MIASKPIPHGQIENYTTADIADSVDKRYQTEEQQTYNDATSSIQTQLNTKLASTSWIDYSATSTVVGWSSFVDKKIFYKIIDNMCFVFFGIDGTSNTTTITFTLPVTNTSGFTVFANGSYHRNNALSSVNPPRVQIVNASNEVAVFRDLSGSTWTASGLKTVTGQFSFKIN